MIHLGTTLAEKYFNLYLPLGEKMNGTSDDANWVEFKKTIKMVRGLRGRMGSM